jgi:enoyl-CoA hydratase/carnithine racemase
VSLLPRTSPTTLQTNTELRRTVERMSSVPAPDVPTRDAGQSGVLMWRPTEHIVELILDRPGALNAVSTDLASHLGGMLRAIAADAAVRAVVLSSSQERAFCVGADLKERAGFSNEQLLAQRPLIRGMFAALLDLPMPVIAAVGGFALGGGFELALSCDLIVADETAVFGLTEVTVGLVPGGGGTQLLARRIGAGRAADLVLTGRKVDAPEAYRLGIVDRPATDVHVRQLALDIAATIEGNSPLAVRHAKHALRSGLNTSLHDGLEIEDAAWRAAAMSADRREGISAFTEKRAPRWTGQ